MASEIAAWEAGRRYAESFSVMEGMINRSVPYSKEIFDSAYEKACDAINVLGPSFSMEYSGKLNKLRDSVRRSELEETSC